MGRYLGPQCRYCRTEKIQLFLKGERCKGPKCAITKKRGAPGKGPRSRMRKISDYGLQLREKQKLKRMYGMRENQFKRFFDKASRMKGITGDNLIQLLERRLDNIVYRMRFSTSRKNARQLVLHGHILVNNKRVNIPSYLIRENDKIEVQKKSKKLIMIKESLKEYSRSGAVQWLEVNPDDISGMVKTIPSRNDVIDLSNIREQLIVELYSK